MWLCIRSYRCFEGTFENTQWGKVKQMQPMWLCIFLCKRFEVPFEDAQWRKVKQMQPVLLWIISCRQFKETLKNVWTILRWRKRMQLMWLWIITGTQFLKTFEETKQVCADTLTDIHILGQSDTKLVWGSDSNYWEIMNESIFAGLWQSLSGKVRAEWKSTMNNGLKGNG